MKLFLGGVMLATLTLLQGCATPSYREYPARVAPVDPSSLNFEDIERAAEPSIAVTIIGLRRVEEGVHIVLAIEIPQASEQWNSPNHNSVGLDGLGFLLEALPPKSFEILNADGDVVYLRQGKRTELNQSRNMTVFIDHSPGRVPGRERLFYKECRFRTSQTLPEGTYRVRAIPAEFQKAMKFPATINADQRTFTPVYVPPLPTPG